MVTQSIGQALMGAGVTAVAGIGGAATGYVIAPSLSVVIGAVTAIVAAMAWVDKRIDRRLVDYGNLEAARAKLRDETLLRKVEEMMHKE